MKKWRIYIVGHNKIHDETVCVDKGFNNENYCFLNVGSQNRLLNSEKYSTINQRELSGYVNLGKWWAESEGLYNVWRSRIWCDLDYIGFIHYDTQLRLDKKYVLGSKTNITDRINCYIKNKDKAHISFATFSTEFDWGQRILLDDSKPNTLVGDGKNCYHTILEDYNNFSNTGYSIGDFLEKKYINLCSCFLIDIEGYDKMMRFFDYIVSSHKLEKYDTQHQYRIQGGMAERYFGIFMMFEYSKMLDLNLVHMYDAGWK